jgi:hypothetical protein
MFKWHDQKLIIFAFFSHFHELLPIVLGLWGDLLGPWHLVHVWVTWPKTCHFCVYGRFRELLTTILVFRSDLQGPWHLVHVWVARPQTRRFCILGSFSWTISHSFRVPGWFTRTMTLRTYLRGTTKTLTFCVFRAVSMSYCPLFWGFVDIYKEYDNMYILERNEKTRHFCVYGRFHELLPTVSRFWGDLQGPWHLIHIWVAWPCYCILGPFSWAIAHSFGVPRWFTRPMTLSTSLIGMTKTSSFLRLGPFLWAIAHSFGVSWWFRRTMTRSTFLRGMTKNSPFCVLGPFSWAIAHCLGVPGTFTRNMIVCIF